jgi:hypothetical protein
MKATISLNEAARVCADESTDHLFNVEPAASTIDDPARSLICASDLGAVNEQKIEYDVSQLDANTSLSRSLRSDTNAYVPDV